MKKQNEGYALPFVLVVLVVLCITAVGIMDFSLRNLESQQANNQRMKEKYAAAAQIEEIIAVAEKNKEGFFPETDTLRFLIEKEGENNRYLRVISASSVDSEVWVAAKISMRDQKGNIVQSFGKSESVDKSESVLTVIGQDVYKVQVLEYKIVDQQTAWAYVGYNPKTEEMGDVA